MKGVIAKPALTCSCQTWSRPGHWQPLVWMLSWTLTLGPEWRKHAQGGGFLHLVLIFFFDYLISRNMRWFSEWQSQRRRWGWGHRWPLHWLLGKTPQQNFSFYCFALSVCFWEDAEPWLSTVHWVWNRAAETFLRCEWWQVPASCRGFGTAVSLSVLVCHWQDSGCPC